MDNLSDLESGTTILIKKIGQQCNHGSCTRDARYTYRGVYLCERCFQLLKSQLAKRNVNFIFPRYQEPQFPRTQSNMLVLVSTKSTSLGRKWGKRRHQGRGRTSVRRTIKIASVRKQAAL